MNYRLQTAWACTARAPTKRRVSWLILVALVMLCFPGATRSSAAAQTTAPAPMQLPRELAGLSAQESASLIKGEALIREVGAPSKLALSPFDAEAEAIRKGVAQLNPNYLTEVIALVPFEAGAGQTEKLAAALSDLEGYVGIPYWSVSMQKTYDLFDKMTILSKKPIPGGAYIEAEQHMKPFDDYKASYEYRVGADALVFRSVNLSHLSYKGFRSVSPGGMKWFLYVFHSSGFLVYYGVGAVRAFDMLGLIRDRLEVSFVGRVGAFFDHMYTRLKE